MSLFWQETVSQFLPSIIMLPSFCFSKPAIMLKIVDLPHPDGPNSTGGYDLGMLEVSEIASLVEEQADRDCILIFGAAVDEEMHDEISITVIATGFDEGLEGAAGGSKSAEKPSEADPKKQGLGSYDDVFGRVDGLDGKEVTLQDILQKEEEEKGTSRFEIPSFL